MLRGEALSAAKWRGHDMGPFLGSVAKCTECGRQVHVDLNPPPNGIDISGEAVAVDCDGGEHEVSE